ncbi:TetR/AcrR family transcriptional regulator [Sulfurovum sp. NBC37-1]|uniref:TetR/AcrR family transcriptional regulator n=1 Tax=Sulfurovum sp. (strain NBC37-1) TaxID=387093 RepID=UPI0001587993|nr:TetR/AcrR family transcriptional regulator [Sulfurovum sp. NBC37-1]BAF72380.1 transcriptional regulator, TetR family [Sulfurovum sp. NBC37-1]
MSKKIQKRDAEASKQLIITHAIELFSQKGYGSASMDELAERCGLNKAMVFYYFKNKKGLYEAVMREVLVEIQQTIIDENKQHSRPKDELEGFIRTYAKFACEHPYMPSLLLKELSDSGAIVPEMLFASMRQLFALFSDILKRGEEKGCFTNAIPMILYFMVLGTLNLMVTTKPLRIKASQLEDIDVDTCASCDIDEITDYVVEKIFRMLDATKQGDLL